MTTIRRSCLKAVSFDGDMTLWDFQKVMHHSLRIVLRELRRRVPGRQTEAVTVEQLVEIRNQVAAAAGRAPNLEEVRLRAFERTLELLGCANGALAAELNALYLKHRFEDIELYADVLPCLDALRSHFMLGLVSDGNGYPERSGLEGVFGFVVFAQDVGVTKPDAVLFQTACRRAGCTPNELLHIGDSLELDVAGAKGIGAVSVWLNRAGTRNDTAIVPDFEIRSLTEIPDIVTGLNGTFPSPLASDDPRSAFQPGGCVESEPAPG